MRIKISPYSLVPRYGSREAAAGFFEPHASPNKKESPMRNDILRSVAVSLAQYAVIGVSKDGARGVLSWHVHEFVAKRAAAEVRKAGGTGDVYPAPNGDLSAQVLDSIVNGFSAR
jgi:hypothetical protein